MNDSEHHRRSWPIGPNWKRKVTKMHKLTPPDADCPKCGCERAFVDRPEYREIHGSADGISGVMEWECGVCGYAMFTEPLDGKAPRPSSIE